MKEVTRYINAGGLMLRAPSTSKVKDNCSEFDDLIEKLHEDHPEQMEGLRIWVNQFMDEQESLGYEFNKLIEDNYWELLLE